MLNIDAQKERFKNHVASFQDLGNIKILDFKKPKSSNYRIRFMFEEDYCRCHISGDLGELVATNYNNMTYEGFEDFVHNTGYFEGKIDCMSREIYDYDYELAEKQLRERLKEIDEDGEDIEIDDVVSDMMDDFRNDGFGSKAYDILNEFDPCCYEYIGDFGKERTGILELYMLAFELAKKQIDEKEVEHIKAELEAVDQERENHYW